MTETNINEKIVETISNILKKTKVFEKLNRIEFYAFSFVTVTSIYGIVNLFFNNYRYNRNITYNEKHKTNYENIIKNYNTLSVSILKYNKLLEERIHNLDQKIVSLIQNQQQKIDDYSNLPICNIMISDEKNKEPILTETNISDIANVYNNENKVVYETDEEYIDLVDNSYSSLPCVNGNKLTGFNRLLNWE